MFHSFVLLILFNSFFIVAAKPYNTKDESVMVSITTKTKPNIMTKKRTISLDIQQNSKRCKVIIFPRFDWHTDFPLPDSAYKFRHFKKVCNGTTATTPNTTTAAEATFTITPTTSMAKTKYTQNFLHALLNEVCVFLFQEK